MLLSDVICGPLCLIRHKSPPVLAALLIVCRSNLVPWARRILTTCCTLCPCLRVPSTLSGVTPLRRRIILFLMMRCLPSRNFAEIPLPALLRWHYTFWDGWTVLYHWQHQRTNVSRPHLGPNGPCHQRTFQANSLHFHARRSSSTYL